MWAMAASIRTATSGSSAWARRWRARAPSSDRYVCRCASISVVRACGPSAEAPRSFRNSSSRKPPARTQAVVAQERSSASPGSVSVRIAPAHLLATE